MAYKRISPQPVVEGGTGAATLTGVLIGNGTSAVTATAVTQHDILVGAASNSITSVAPSATSGIPLVSNGSSADPSFTTAVVAGGGTGAVTLTGVLIGNGTSAVTGNAVTQHDVLVGGTSNAITSVAPAATSGIPLVSNGSSADPSFTTAVVAGGGTGNTTFTAFSIICAGTTATGAFQNVSGLGTSGQALISAGAGALPTWTTINGSFTWTVETANLNMVINHGYIANKAGTLTMALPTTSAVGSIIEITGINTATGWQVTQASGQQIFMGTSSTTLGATGTLTSSAIRDSISMVCVVANTTWNVLSSIGNITVV